MSKLETTSCNLCGSESYTVRYEARLNTEDPDSASCTCTNTGHGEHYRIVRCDECGLLYCSPRPPEQLTFDSYSGVQDTVYKEQELGRTKTFSRLLDELVKYSQANGRILDIGSSTGVFLNLAASRGWDVQGIEPSVWCTEEAQKNPRLSGRVRQGSFDDTLKLEGEFDVISMWDVIEHLHDPMKSLEICKRKLKSGGILAISTIDVDSPFARLCGQHWPWLMKMHLYYFSRKTISACLSESGFELICIKPHVYVISLEYLRFKLESLCRPAGKALKVITDILHLKRTDIYIPVSLGDCITVYARKHKNS